MCVLPSRFLGPSCFKFNALPSRSSAKFQFISSSVTSISETPSVVIIFITKLKDFLIITLQVDYVDFIDNLRAPFIYHHHVYFLDFKR